MGIQSVRGPRRAAIKGSSYVSPKYLLPGTVYDAAKKRIRWLIHEFDGKIAVSTSGGKDSTVVAELAIEVAREESCLPVTMVWLDQECEYQATAEYQRRMADRPETDFRWYQIPFNLYNATNHDEPWLHVWGEGEEWVREKESDSIHENIFIRPDGTTVDRFKELLIAINTAIGGAFLTGVRSEESPTRRAFLITNPGYKWVTWVTQGQGHGRGHYWLFHPIYDWSYRDVWKAILDNDWTYNVHYDRQFRLGTPTNKMRVSNYHHETALDALFNLQEFEPETWEKATKRLMGISTAGHIGRKDWQPKELPYMFASWWEYLDYLIDNLVTVEEYQRTFRGRAAALATSLPWVSREQIAREMVRAVIGNDLYGTTTQMFKVVHTRRSDKAEWARRQREQEEAFSG
jgi:predicted phosphoadenosine phosphosulfate sulfurtransferase